ncbi:MAG: type II secretion system minor pseudopilin GspI [Pseudomonadales bacterium]|jgi:general secretion pathway protein I
MVWLRPKQLQARKSCGFTLIEVVIAVTIFAVVSIAVFTRASDIVNQSAGLEKRTFATWIAQDRLTRLKVLQARSRGAISLGRDTELVIMAGREWRVEAETETTSNPYLTRVELEVFLDDDSDEVPWGRLVGFVGRH